MTQDIFLSELKMELQKRQIYNISDILADYQEHFEHARAKGKSDREVIQALGSPTTLAQAHQAEGLVSAIKADSEVKNSMALFWSAVGRVLVLTPFNFFMLVIPGVLIFSFLVSGWAVTFAIGAIGVASLSTTSLFTEFVGGWPWLLLACAFLGLLSLCVFMSLAMTLVSTWIGKLVVVYMRWNVRMVLQK